MPSTPPNRPASDSPKWWTLYLLFGVFLGVLLLETQLPVSDTVHRILEVGPVLGFSSLINRWLKANEIALLRESMRECRNSSGRRTTASRDTD